LVSALPHAAATAHAAGAVPALDPPTPTDPGNSMPGRDKIGQIEFVARFITLGIAFIGGLMVAGGMMLSHRRGEGATHLGALGIWGAGVFLVGIVGALISWLSS
ncbi:hypothetical protein ACFVUP_38430, partial [Streptomyces bacillaris]|uniref:hypothetical protein n=1 Tax=Streptomyces bacillaris TaxID=68179 RepID=UPI0036D9FF88